MITRESEQPEHHPNLKPTPKNASDKEIRGQGYNSKATTSSACQETLHVYTIQMFINVSVTAHHLLYCQPD